MSQNSSPSKDSPVVAFLKRRWLALVILAVVVILIVANRDPVTFNLVFTSFETPEWVVIAGTFLLGGVAGWIARSRRTARKG